MVLFSKLFVSILVSGSLIFCGLAALILLILLFLDFKGGKVW